MSDVLPEKLDINIYAGDDFELQLAFVDDDDVAINITGWTIRSQVRRTFNGPVVASFTVVIPAPATQGFVDLSLVNTDTEDLAGRYVWDCERLVGGKIRTLVRGEAQALRDVTRV